MEVRRRILKQRFSPNLLQTRKQKIYHVRVLVFCKFSCLIALEQCHPEEFNLRLEQIQMQLQDMKRELLNGVSHVGERHIYS